MPIDRSQPVFHAMTDADGAHDIRYSDRTVSLRVLTFADDRCAEVQFERRDFGPQQTPAKQASPPQVPGNRNRRRKSCGGCASAARRTAVSEPAQVVLTGWKARLHRRAVRELACANCELSQRRFGLEWCGSPRNIWRRIVGRLTDGCGCLLSIKRRVGRAECPLDKWGQP